MILKAYFHPKFKLPLHPDVEFNYCNVSLDSQIVVNTVLP